MLKCKDCKYCKDRAHTGNARGAFYCEHPHQTKIIRYFNEHRLSKMPGFIAFSVNSMIYEPNIKTSPVWCPYKLEKKERELKARLEAE